MVVLSTRLRPRGHVLTDLVHVRHAHQVGKYILENTLLLDAALRFTAADVLINLAQMITPFTSLPELSAPPQQPRARMSTLPVAPTPAPDGDTSDITGPNYPRPPPLAAPVANTHAQRAPPATLDGDMRPVTRHAAADTSADVDVNMPHVEVNLDGGAVENRVEVATAEEGQAEDRTEEASQGEVNGDGAARACQGDQEGSHAAETEHIASSEDPSTVPRAGKMESQARQMLEDASPWGKHAPVYKLSAIAAETSMESLGEDDEEWEDSRAVLVICTKKQVKLSYLAPSGPPGQKPHVFEHRAELYFVARPYITPDDHAKLKKQNTGTPNKVTIESQIKSDST